MNKVEFRLNQMANHILQENDANDNDKDNDNDSNSIIQ